MITATTTGLIGEHIAAASILSMGWRVGMAQQDSVDLLAWNNATYVRVQVKSASPYEYNKGGYQFQLGSGSKSKKLPSIQLFDMIALVAVDQRRGDADMPGVDLGLLERPDALAIGLGEEYVPIALQRGPRSQLGDGRRLAASGRADDKQAALLIRHRREGEQCLHAARSGRGHRVGAGPAAHLRGAHAGEAASEVLRKPGSDQRLDRLAQGGGGRRPPGAVCG